MAERGITDADLESALAKRFGPPEPGDMGRICICGYAVDGRILKVVLTADEGTVVTLMWRY